MKPPIFSENSYQGPRHRRPKAVRIPQKSIPKEVLQDEISHHYDADHGKQYCTGEFLRNRTLVHQNITQGEMHYDGKPGDKHHGAIEESYSDRP